MLQYLLNFSQQYIVERRVAMSHILCHNSAKWHKQGAKSASATLPRCSINDLRSEEGVGWESRYRTNILIDMMEGEFCDLWFTLRMENEDLSIQDCSVLKLAERVDVILLTDDKDLRHFSKKTADWSSRNTLDFGSADWWTIDRTAISGAKTPEATRYKTKASKAWMPKKIKKMDERIRF